MSNPSAPETDADSKPHGHSDGDHEHTIMNHAKPYFLVGGILLFFTLVTVWLSYVDFDRLIGGHGWNIIIAMVVATFKVSLVGAIFMHLKGEKKTIWRPLFFTAFFVTGLFLLTMLHFYDPIHTTHFNHH